MNKKSVLINASMLSANPTGVGIYGEQIVPRLIKQLEAASISYACFCYLGEYKANFNKIKLPVYIDFIFRRSLSVHRLIWNIFYLPRIAKKYDLVYSFSTHGSPFINKQVITVHDLISLNYPSQHKFQYYYFKYIVPSILKVCQSVIAISDFTKSETIKFYPEIDSKKISVIYNGADHLSSELNDMGAYENQLTDLTGGKPFLLTVGASYNHKNIEIILSAAKPYTDSHMFLILGRDTNYFNKLKETKERSGLSNVVFMDYVEPGFLKLLYKRAVANLYVSLYEGFGLTPLEASFFDCVSIVSNTSSLPEIYKDSVIYIEPEASDLIKKINYVISPAFKKEKYLKKFGQLRSLYSWDDCSGKIFSIINNLENGN